MEHHDGIEPDAVVLDDGDDRGFTTLQRTETRSAREWCTALASASCAIRKSAVSVNSGSLSAANLPASNSTFGPSRRLRESHHLLHRRR